MSTYVFYNVFLRSSAILVTVFESCVREPDKVSTEDSFENSNSKHALLQPFPPSSSATTSCATSSRLHENSNRASSAGIIAGHSNYGKFSIVGEEDEDEDEESGDEDGRNTDREYTA